MGKKLSNLESAADSLMNNLWGKVHSSSRTFEENWFFFEKEFPGVRSLSEALDDSIEKNKKAK